MSLFNKTAASWNAPGSKEENTFSFSKHTLSISISNACLILNFCIYHYPWNTVVVAQNHWHSKATNTRTHTKIQLNQLILFFLCVQSAEKKEQTKEDQINHYKSLDKLADWLHNVIDTVESKSLSTFFWWLLSVIRTRSQVYLIRFVHTYVLLSVFLHWFFYEKQKTSLRQKLANRNWFSCDALKCTLMIMHRIWSMKRKTKSQN